MFMNAKKTCLLFLNSLLGLNLYSQEINMPIIQTKYTADPAPYVHNDTVYLYTTHDEDNSEGFNMKDWLLYTSTDMINWQDHGAVASLKDFKWYTGNNGAWAEQVIERNGKWYMYCPIHGNGIGVLVSDSPYGPFKDPIGKPLVWQREHWNDIDPSVMIDDDGQAYMYWGNPDLYYVKLNEDMINYFLDFVKNQPKDSWLHFHCKEGIGRTTTFMIMYDIIKNSDNYGLNRVYGNTREFVNAIEDLRAKKDSMKISELIKATLQQTGYSKALELEKTIEAETRLENLDEFLTVAIEFEDESADNSLSEFLEGITLSSDLDGMEETEDSVTLMTLHSAKGLEFPVVFLVGMEEGIFPHYNSINEGTMAAIEEERRLAYVAITRAKRVLYITIYSL